MRCAEQIRQYGHTPLPTTGVLGLLKKQGWPTAAKDPVGEFGHLQMRGNRSGDSA